MWAGTLPYRVQDLHRKYGNVVRTGPNELSFAHPDAWKDIYSRRDSCRPEVWQGKLPGLDAHTLVSAPAAEHARFRKAFGTAFSEKAVRLQEPLLTKYIDSFMNSIRKKQKENTGSACVVNLAEWINFATFDIMSDLGWGTSFDCLADGEYHPWVLAVLWYKGLLLGVTLKIYPILGMLVALITPKSAHAGVQMVVETSKSNVRDRLSKPSSRPDLITAITDYNRSSQPDEQISQDEMITNSSTIIVAGSDPLASVVAGALTYLIREPRLLAELESEVRSSFTSDRDITAESTKPLPYLQMVLLEALRLCTPVPDNMRRFVAAAGGATIAGHHVPHGTTVGMSAYTAFRDATTYTAPDEFRPERWRSVVGKDGVSLLTRYPGFHPFGFGPRSCMGQPLAWAEMRLLLARLVWNFDIRNSKEASVKPWTAQPVYWTWQRDPMPVLIRPAGTERET